MLTFKIFGILPRSENLKFHPEKSASFKLFLNISNLKNHSFQVKKNFWRNVENWLSY